MGGKHGEYHRRLLTLFFCLCFLLLDDTKLNQYAGSEGKPLIFSLPAHIRSKRKHVALKSNALGSWDQSAGWTGETEIGGMESR